MSYDQTDQDQLYIEDGYFTPDGYYVYIAEAKVDLTPYIDEGYIEANYYEYYGGSATLTAELSLVEGELEEASASLTASATQSTVAVKTTDVVSTQSSEFTQTATSTKIVQFDVAVTSAFTPVMTVEAIRNSFAVLDAVVSINIDAVANRAANITIESIVNQSLSGDRTRDYASSQSSQFTQTANATKSVTASSAQSSAFTITAGLGGPVRASAELNSRFQLLTAKYINGGRPLNLSGSNYQFITTPKQYGTHALNVFSNGILTTAVDQTLIPAANQEFVIEFWWDSLRDKFGPSDPIIMYLGTGTTDITSITSNTAWAIGIETNDVLGTHQLQFKFRNNINNVVTVSGSIATYTSKMHIAVRRGNDGIIRLYRDNNQIGSVSYSGTFSINAPATNCKLTFTGDEFSIGSGNSGVMFDEFSYRIGSSTISGYTDVIINDPDSQKALYHFDNTLDDDVTVTYNIGASLTATSTISARLTGSVFAQSQITSSFAVNSDAGIVKSAESSVNSEFTQNCNFDRIRSADSAQLSAFTSTISADVTRSTGVDLSSAFTQSATVLRIQQGAANFDAVASQLAAVAKIGDFLIACDVIASQTTIAVKTTDVVSNQSAEFTQTAVGIKAVENSATLVAEFAESITGRRLAGLDSAQSSAFIQTADVNYTAENTSNQTATSSLSADAAGSTVGFASAQSAEFTQSAVVDRIRSDSSTQSSAFTQVTDVMYIRGVDSNQTATSTLDASVTRIQQGAASFDTVASQLTAAAKIGDFFVACDIVASQTAVVNITASATSTQSSAFTQNANANAQVGFNNNFEQKLEKMNANAGRDVNMFPKQAVYTILIAIISFVLIFLLLGIVSVIVITNSYRSSRQREMDRTNMEREEKKHGLAFNTDGSFFIAAHCVQADLQALVLRADPSRAAVQLS